MSDNGQFIGTMGTVDSGKFLFADILKPLKTMEEICAVIGCYYAGKGTWFMMKKAFIFMKLYSFIPLTMSFRTSYRIRYGTFALVSNVTEGLSTEIVFALADRGLNVMMFGTNSKYLYTLEHRLRLEFGVHSIVIVTTPHETFLINDVMRLVAKYDVGILVNYFGDIDSTANYFGNCNPQIEWEQIPKSVGKSMMLTRFVLPGMYSRGRGVIVNVVPTLMTNTRQKLPFSVTAMSCLSFIKTLGECIRTSYSFRGIKVQTVTPYMDAVIRTLAEEESSKRVYVNLQPTMSQYARSLVCLIGECEDTHGYWTHSVYYGLSQIFPERAMRKFALWIRNEPVFEDGIIW